MKSFPFIVTWSCHQTTESGVQSCHKWRHATTDIEHCQPWQCARSTCTSSAPSQRSTPGKEMMVRQPSAFQKTLVLLWVMKTPTHWDHDTLAIPWRCHRRSQQPGGARWAQGCRWQTTAEGNTGRKRKTANTENLEATSSTFGWKKTLALNYVFLVVVKERSVPMQNRRGFKTIIFFWLKTTGKKTEPVCCFLE